jgi:site-specific recombinase XerD
MVATTGAAAGKIENGIGKSLKGKGRWKIEDAGMTFDETMEKFLQSRRLGINGANHAVKDRTLHEYKGDLKVFFDFVKGLGMTCYAELKPETINAFLEFMQSPERGKGGWSKATQRKYLISLKAYFRWVTLDPDCKAAKMESFFTNLPRIGKEVRREFVPSQAQMDTFRNGFDKTVVWGLRDWTVLTLMLDTGARVGEVCNLEPEDVYWDVSMINLEGKTGKRLVPYSEETGQALAVWMNIRKKYIHEGCNKVFVSRYGGATIPNTFAQAFSDNLKRTRLDKTLGDETISCHTVRHYFCTMYLVNGGMLHNLQKITGHKTMDTLMIYVNLASQMKTVAEEHSRVSPLKKMNQSVTNDKKRRLVRL